MLGEKQRGGSRGTQCRRGTQAEFSVTQCDDFLKLGILEEKTSRTVVPGPAALKGAGFELWRGLTCRQVKVEEPQNQKGQGAERSLEGS